MSKYEEGSVLLLSLLIMTVLFVMVAGALRSVNNEIKISSYNQDRVKANYIAEAGLEFAKAKVSDNNIWNNNKIIKDFGGGRFTVTKSLTNNQLDIVSEATYKEMTKKLSSTYLYNSDINQTFKYSLAARGVINVNNKATIIGNSQGGDLYSNGNIILGNNSTYFDCNIKRNQADEFFLDFDIIELKEKAEVTIASNNNSPTIDGSKVTYSDHDLNLANNSIINGNGILIVNGDLTIENEVKINVDEDNSGQFNSKSFVIIVTGNITIKNKFNMRGLLYSQGSMKDIDGSADIGNKAKVRGSIIANEGIEIKNKLELTYDNSYLDTFSSHGINLGDVVKELRLINFRPLF
ncbi:MULTISPECIES: pilus assembly PilX N-terminal domain-containing protein [unclassified Candidatus Frackibacter]|uniref:pilus assembly PilX N-terminal domain-containing protein n=1 Tax=unclassified Candidatus Frackibacter TaxID=2648818 RepID=UPI000881C7F9|nr:MULTISPECIES: pilus assembly PilX N-terminal domain-containing protein [unclassified Candidatus Frackibacter]SDC03344.1 hypothetical protein SAMN04515661_101370 [Candidatus Frackibacter sp. WG11]SEM69047.1 hypothetical protein SAMN04488698_11240 [Candidatus Frackibacter sp. WG12]SFL80342.1 hypothetical protein SAMN04488699_11440 [Candidatus Frackibacter sp. WG13]